MKASWRPERATFQNEILAALPPKDIEHLRPQLSRVSLVSGQVLHERDSLIEDVFFMEEGIASLTADTMDYGAVEVGLTGREGLVGPLVLLNPEALAIHRAFVQVPGAAFRMRAAVLRQAVEQSPALRDCCLRYIHWMVVQASQAAACNARHEVAKRLARWLLLTHDRVDGNDLPVTQEFLSLMLGVRRSGVSIAANTLQAGGLIEQARGRIRVLDRAGLEAASCKCYGIVQRSRELILGSPKQSLSGFVHSLVVKRTNTAVVS
jgi:CRP-like cAMP-binding protein